MERRTCVADTDTVVRRADVRETVDVRVGAGWVDEWLVGEQVPQTVLLQFRHVIFAERL